MLFWPTVHVHVNPQVSTAIKNMETGCCWYGSTEQSWLGRALLKNFTKPSSAQATVKLQVQKETSLHSCFTFLCRTKTVVVSLCLTNKPVGAKQLNLCYIIHEQGSNPDTFPAWPQCFHGTTSLHWSLGRLSTCGWYGGPFSNIDIKEISKLSKTDHLCLADKIRMEEEKDKSKNCNISWE